jgi:hypothetical protein
LPSWNDTGPKKAIITFVERITKEGGPHFIPVSEHIATFCGEWHALGPAAETAMIYATHVALRAENPEFHLFVLPIWNMRLVHENAVHVYTVKGANIG